MIFDDKEFHGFSNETIVARFDLTLSVVIMSTFKKNLGVSSNHQLPAQCHSDLNHPGSVSRPRCSALWKAAVQGLM